MLDYELGVIDRAAQHPQKVAWYKGRLAGRSVGHQDGTEILFRPLAEGDTRESGRGDAGRAESRVRLELWAIRPDGTGERFVTTGWSPTGGSYTCRTWRSILTVVET